LRVFLKPNQHFRLPGDTDRPIIMIGPGTGVAPFRAFIQERDAVGARGRNWLVFGHRNYTHDFLYQLEWQDLLKRGVLTRLDVAFSRDQPEKRYVQHALWEARRDLHAWLQDGAVIYVCGDANAMAKDVHATLQRILGEHGKDGVAALDALRREGRYLRDVY
jgi:sulfite reductase (NADPH) flavoprotein alpha-component